MITDRGILKYLTFSGPSDEEAQTTTLVRRFQRYGRNRDPWASEGGQRRNWLHAVRIPFSSRLQ